MKRVLNSSPYYLDDPPQDEVISSPIAYPQFNWDPTDDFVFNDSKKDTYSPDISFDFEAAEIDNTIQETSCEDTNFFDSPSLPTIPPLDLTIKSPSIKRVQSAPRLSSHQKTKISAVFRPFADCFSAELTVQRLRSQMASSQRL